LAEPLTEDDPREAGGYRLRAGGVRRHMGWHGQPAGLERPQLDDPAEHPGVRPQGSYDSPSTACTGSVSVQSSSGSVLTALAATASRLNPDCALLAHLTLTLTGPGQLSMTWGPTGLRNELGTAVLTRS